jgi:hypothetical protein
LSRFSKQTALLAARIEKRSDVAEQQASWGREYLGA